MGAEAHLPVTFDDVREKNVNSFKKLNSVVFPIKYQDKIYNDCIVAGSVTQLAFYTDILVGGIGCRLEKAEAGGARMHVLTLGVLAPYRDRGIGSKLLEHSLAEARKNPDVECAFLHVQVSNEGAIRFYQRHGFEVVETVAGYYKRLDPPDAVLLRHTFDRS